MMPAAIEVETRLPQEVVDITERVRALVAGAPTGACRSVAVRVLAAG